MLRMRRGKSLSDARGGPYTENSLSEHAGKPLSRCAARTSCSAGELGHAAKATSGAARSLGAVASAPARSTIESHMGCQAAGTDTRAIFRQHRGRARGHLDIADLEQSADCGSPAGKAQPASLALSDDRFSSLRSDNWRDGWRLEL